MLSSHTLLLLERAQVTRLALWALFAMLLGGTSAAGLAIGRVSAPLLRQWALAFALCGAVELAFAAFRWRVLGERDYAAALHLETVVKLSLVVELGAVAGGVVAAAVAGAVRRQRAAGASAAIALHALALFALDRTFLAHLQRGV